MHKIQLFVAQEPRISLLSSQGKHCILDQPSVSLTVLHFYLCMNREGQCAHWKMDWHKTLWQASLKRGASAWNVNLFFIHIERVFLLHLANAQLQLMGGKQFKILIGVIFIVFSLCTPNDNSVLTSDLTVLHGALEPQTLFPFQVVTRSQFHWFIFQTPWLLYCLPAYKPTY